MTTERLRLLLVEPDEAEVSTIQRALAERRLDYPLYVVNTGEQALQALRSGQVPRDRLLVLLGHDVLQPAGLETLRAIRADPQLALLPVVLLTHLPDPQAQLKAYQLHVAGCFRRPVPPEELQQQLEALCNYWAATEMP